MTKDVQNLFKKAQPCERSLHRVSLGNITVTSPVGKILCQIRKILVHIYHLILRVMTGSLTQSSYECSNYSVSWRRVLMDIDIVRIPNIETNHIIK